jgi:hypothetical protein
MLVFMPPRRSKSLEGDLAGYSSPVHRVATWPGATIARIDLPASTRVVINLTINCQSE